MDEIDQFELLETKIDSLVSHVSALKREKESLAEKVGRQEERIADLTKEIEALKASRERARQKIVHLLDKIDRLGIP
ncbi:MAG: cell division protein ZapB [Deltaproteobacteria bacterium]|nr:cell division protein ZapB [Deltaproteobacteria bacterium]MBW2135978.1 cell division protein ZapB [Deltaproteobacteria bacterium]